MTSITPATSLHEEPVHVAAGDATLFAIVTRPPRDPLDTAAVILSGGGATAPATNRNRMSVHLARALAGVGYHAMRFDYHGIGESTGILAGPPKVDEPYLDDVDATIAWLKQAGIHSFVLVGACFGARTALSYAPLLPGLKGVVLISPPLRDIDLGDEGATKLALTIGMREAAGRALRVRTMRGLFHPARRQSYRQFVKVKLGTLVGRERARAADGWVSGRFLEPIADLAERGVPLVFVYGTKDWHYRDFKVACTGRLGTILRRAPAIRVVELEGEVHGLTNVRVQERVTDLVIERLRRWAGRAPKRGSVTQEVSQA